jgi:glycosyltransferase involved in cell wall biosynthesis
VRVALLNWRDTTHPEGGGSEVYLEHMAVHLVQSGHDVTLVTAQPGGLPAQETRDGVRVLRGGSKLGVYREARRLLRSGTLGDLDVVVDTQNAIPFLSPWATDAPVVVLVHHVHREQWPVIYDPLRARVGWWIESRLAPRVYRHSSYIAVSEATLGDLEGLGVDAARIHVVRNGITSSPQQPTPRDRHPRILVLGRLVPHKRVEHVLSSAAELRSRYPGLTVAVVGDGWWHDDLRAVARRLRVDDIVEFTGRGGENEKIRQIDRSWVLALPSLKEGWGLVVMEAADRGVPAIAYAEAGGVRESIVADETGLLVHGDADAFTRELDRLIRDDELRTRLGQQAQKRAAEFTWDESGRAFEQILLAATASSRRPRRGRRP